jgi:hypothetical protein
MSHQTPMVRPAVKKEVVVFVRIIATPPGEAPEAVRRAWVGLELPLAAGETGPLGKATVGVLSGRTFWRRFWKVLTFQWNLQYGYVIDSRRALFLLADKDPRAARWWRENVPGSWESGRKFVFAAEACEEVIDGGPGRPIDRSRTPSKDFFPACPPDVTRNPDHEPPDPGIQERPKPRPGERSRGSH